MESVQLMVFLLLTSLLKLCRCVAGDTSCGSFVWRSGCINIPNRLNTRNISLHPIGAVMAVPLHLFGAVMAATILEIVKFTLTVCLFKYYWKQLIQDGVESITSAVGLSTSNSKSAPKAKSSDSESDVSFDSILSSVLLRPVDTDQWVYTVPRYPDNHNPLLPLNLQQELEEMSPREYLTYVHKELTLEERESLMVDEKQRRKTFLINWPYDDQRSGIRMAQAGFYSLDAHDRVQCVFCRGSLHNWDVNDIPTNKHAKSFNYCKFSQGIECGNRKYSCALVEKDIKNVTRFQPLSDEDKQKQEAEGVADHVALGISTSRTVIAEYSSVEARRSSFENWSSYIEISHKKLSEAGFFFTGTDDVVCCFYCAGKLEHWHYTDDPWEEHARWFPECFYLLQQKGEAYVDDVHAKTPEHKRCTRKRTITRGNTSDIQKPAPDGDPRCRKCEKEFKNSVLYIGLPCGHAIYCEQCNAEESRKAKLQCPYPKCENPLTGTFKTFCS